MLKKVMVERKGTFQALRAESSGYLMLLIDGESAVLDGHNEKLLSEAIAHGRNCYLITSLNCVELDDDGMTINGATAHLSSPMLEDLLAYISEGRK